MEARDHSTCWLIRDLGVFLFGCIFAGGYIFFGKAALHREVVGRSSKRLVRDDPRQLWSRTTAHAA